MTSGVRTTTTTVHAVHRTDGDAYGRPRQKEEKRTEFIYTQR